MASVQLSDIIDVTVFQDLPPVDGPEKTAFYDSGVIVRNALLDQVAQAAGKTGELPFWKDIDPTDGPNLSDDTSDTSTPFKITQGEQIGRKAFLNASWSETDLAAELALGGDAMTRIRARLDAYWRRQWQRRLVASLNGVLADNVANYSSDMVVDVAVDSATSSSVFTRSNFTAAGFTLGDSYDELSALAVHSVVYKRMVDNDDIDFIPDSQGQMTIPTFLGHRVIVDDGLPVDENGANDPKYTSVLFGAGAVGFGEGTPNLPIEVEREASQGNGGGVEILHSRKTYLLHPFGFKVDDTPSGASFTLTELATAGTWDRVVDRKNVPMAFLVTNG